MLDFVFSIAVLIMSVVIHEVSHGLAANALGDPTAKYEGRLTLNPLKHLDPVGSVLLPVFTYLIGGFIFGWAKPVHYNPYNLKNQRWGPALVGGAGPASNIFVALVFAALLRAFSASAPEPLAAIFTTIVYVNILLAVFNLVPIPPLDGSKVLFALLPDTFHRLQAVLEQYGFMILLLFIFVLWRYLIPLVLLIFRFLVGV